MTVQRLLLWGLTLVFFSLHGSTAQNITLGATLTAGNNSSWPSSNGDFAFGFYLIGSNRYLVGIWFNKIPSKTLVWSSNRDNPAPTGSRVELTKQGLLVGTYPDGKSYPIYRDGLARFAVMQDNGNLVLKDSSSVVVWQSFTSPTDTILPGQVVVPGQELFSNDIGDMNYSTGRFRLQMQQLDGNLVLSAYQFLDFGYWDAKILNVPNVSLVFNSTAMMMYLTNGTQILSRFATNQSLPSEDYYHRATVNNYGNFQHFVYPKASTTGNWTTVWEAVKFPCSVNAVCGVYGYCTTPDNKIVNCTCLPGFFPIDPQLPRKGCYPQVMSEKYCGETPSGISIQVQVFSNSDSPNRVFADMAKLTGQNEESCRQAVLDDCFCMGATLEGTDCNKKRMPLYNARKDTPTTNGKRLLIKVMNTSTYDQANSSTQSTHGKDKSKPFVVGGLVTSSVLALLFICFTVYYNKLIRDNRQKNELKVSSVVDFNLREFTFEELREATKGFSNKLGQGSYGTVYQGTLRSDDKSIEIAVKQLDKVIERGEKEFVTELRVIGRTYHKNLVRLLGFCGEDDHRILVYELVKNGSLSGFLFKEGKKPGWQLRVEIALGIARGLLYLHEECDHLIIHCDIKPQNVLLDQNNIAKIADFGLAKLLRSGGTRTSTNVRGTMGYMAPEWIKNVPVTSKVDVYSFGVMLLEIICCRRHVELDEMEEDNEGDEVVLTDWIVICLKLEKLETVVKHDEEVLSDFERFERMILVGLWCIHPDPVLRPSMKNVMHMLEGAVEVSVPPFVNAQTH